MLTKNTPFRAVCLRAALGWGLATLVILLAQVIIFDMVIELMKQEIRVIYKKKLIVNLIVNAMHYSIKNDSVFPHCNEKNR